jgi:hypothetical protein
MKNEITLLILFIIITLIYMILKLYKFRGGELFENKPVNLRIAPSVVDGVGVFTLKPFDVGDIIVRDIFIGKSPETLGSDMFKGDKFMSKINHCVSRDNTEITKDGDEYHLIATKSIQPGSELTSNYDKTNNEFNFIASSNPDFNKC